MAEDVTPEQLRESKLKVTRALFEKMCNQPMDAFRIENSTEYLVMMEGLAKLIAHLEFPAVCYKCCPKHQGQPFTFNVYPAPPLPIVCPICEKEKKP